MIALTKTILSSIILAALAVQTAVTAQDDDPFGGGEHVAPKSSPPKLPPGETESGNAEEVFDISLPETRLSEFLEIIQAQTKEHLNVTYDKAYAKSPIPALNLKGVTFRGLTELLAAATERSSEGMIEFLETKAGWVFQRTRQGGGGGEDDPFGGGGPARIQAKPRLATFTLGPVLERYGVDDVLTLINEVLTLDGSQGKITMKYHEETKTLLMVLNEEQKAVVSDTISQLRAAAAVPAPENTEMIARQIEELTMAKDLSTNKLQEAARAIADLKQFMAEKEKGGHNVGDIPIKLELLDVEMEVLKSQIASLVAQEMELRSKHRRLESIRRSSKKKGKKATTGN